MLFIYLTFGKWVCTMSHQMYLGIVPVEFFHFPGSQPEITGPDEFIQMVGVGCTRNGSNPWFA